MSAYSREYSLSGPSVRVEDGGSGGLRSTTLLRRNYTFRLHIMDVCLCVCESVDVCVPFFLRLVKKLVI